MHNAMLPILRILPVGGVLLAIMILALALNPPGGLHPSLTPAVMAARGALIQAGDHPEWRHFLILAATRRADELKRLRELPDTPVRAESDAGKVAGLPDKRGDADPDDQTGTIKEAPGVTIPIEIGETSSAELPVTQSEEKPPIIKKPERAKPQKESRKNAVRRAQRAKAPAKNAPATQFNLFESWFGGQRVQLPASDRAQINQPAPVSDFDPH
jgi:hypothetical protein